MNANDARKFNVGIAIPLLNELQDKLAVEIVRLEEIADSRVADRTGADREIWDACKKLANAMDAAGVERNEDGERLVPYDDDEWEPFTKVEKWILGEGYTTGSARVMAICYLAQAIGFKLDWEEVYSGTLDKERVQMVEDMLSVSLAPDTLPRHFWRIFFTYRETLAKERQRQGR